MKLTRRTFLGSAVLAGCERIIVGATEHEAVAETAKASGLPVQTWPVNGLILNLMLPSGYSRIVFAPSC